MVMTKEYDESHHILPGHTDPEAIHAIPTESLEDDQMDFFSDAVGLLFIESGNVETTRRTKKALFKLKISRKLKKLTSKMTRSAQKITYPKLFSNTFQKVPASTTTIGSPLTEDDVEFTEDFDNSFTSIHEITRSPEKINLFQRSSRPIILLPPTIKEQENFTTELSESRISCNFYLASYLALSFEAKRCPSVFLLYYTVDKVSNSLSSKNRQESPAFLQCYTASSHVHSLETKNCISLDNGSVKESLINNLPTNLIDKMTCGDKDKRCSKYKLKKVLRHVWEI